MFFSARLSGAGDVAAGRTQLAVLLSVRGLLRRGKMSLCHDLTSVSRQAVFLAKFCGITIVYGKWHSLANSGHERGAQWQLGRARRNAHEPDLRPPTISFSIARLELGQVILRIPCIAHADSAGFCEIGCPEIRIQIRTPV